MQDRGRAYPERRKPLEHFGIGFLVVFAAAILTYLCRDFEFMNRMEMTNLDSWVSFQNPEPRSEIVVVEITAEEYGSLFHATSPLKPSSLAILVWAIAHSSPKVIGIDMDTTAWPREIRDRVRRYTVTREQGKATRIPVVWALGGYSESGLFALDQIANSNPEDCFAVPASIEDTDGIVRRYFPEVVADKKRWRGFQRAILDASQGHQETCGVTDARGEAVAPVKINFRGGRAAFAHITASVVLGAAFTEAWRADNPLRGRIVLLGGAYHAARDRYLTPVGIMTGVDIAAHTVRSAAPGGSIKDVPEIVFLAVDLLVGIGLVIIAFFTETLWALVGTVVAVPVVAVIASFAVYQSFGYFASFIPMLLGVFFHSLIEHIVVYRRMASELKRLRAANAPTV